MMETPVIIPIDQHPSVDNMFTPDYLQTPDAARLPIIGDMHDYIMDFWNIPPSPLDESTITRYIEAVQTTRLNIIDGPSRVRELMKQIIERNPGLTNLLRFSLVGDIWMSPYYVVARPTGTNKEGPFLADRQGARILKALDYILPLGYAMVYTNAPSFYRPILISLPAIEDQAGLKTARDIRNLYPENDIKTFTERIPQLFQEYKLHDTIKVIAHEIGHHIYAFGIPREMREAWKSITEHYGPVTKYAGEHISDLNLYLDENFAEAFALYLTNPKALRNQFPSTFKFIKNLLQLFDTTA